MLYFDVEANWGNFQRLRGEIESIKKAMSDVSLDDSQVEKLAEQLKKLQAEFDALAAKAAEAGDQYINNFVNKVTSGQQTIEQLGNSIDGIKDKLDSINSENGGGIKITAADFDSEGFVNSIDEAKESLDKLSDNNEKALASLAELLNGLEDESEATEAEIERLTAALEEYQKQAEKAEKKGDGTTSEVLNMQINNIEQGLEDAQKNLELIEQTKDAIKEESAAYTENYTKVIELTARMQYFREEIEKTVATMREMESAGQTNTAEYQYLQQKLGELSASYNEVADGIKNFTKESAELPSKAGDFSALTDEVKEGVDAVAQLTGKNEELADILGKVESVVKTTTKLQGIANKQTAEGTRKQSALGNALSILNGKLVANISGIRGAASAVKVLTAALSTGPLIVVTAVIAVLAKLYSMWQKTREEQQKFNKEVADAATKPIASFKKLKTEWNSLNLEEREKFIKKNAKAFDDLGMSIKNVADAERMLNELDEEYVKLQMKKAKAAAYSKMADEKTNEYAQKNIKQEQRINEEQWGNAEKEIERLEKERAFKLKTLDFGGAAVLSVQIKNAKEALKNGEKYMTLWEDIVTKANKRQQDKLSAEINKYNKKALDAEKEVKEQSEKLGIDTGEIELNSVAYYKQQISILNKDLEKQTDQTGEEVAKIKKQIQGYQNEIDKITGADRERREKLADEQENAELSRQQRLINLQNKGIDKQIKLIDNEYDRKKAERERRERDLAKQLNEGKITGDEYSERSALIDSDWEVTQKELQKKKNDAYKAEAQRRQNFQDEIDRMTLAGQKRNLQLQEDGIDKQLQLIDLEYEEKLKEYEKQERELKKQLKEGQITQEEYDRKSRALGYQALNLDKWEADKQKQDLIDNLVSAYKTYDDKRRDIDDKYEKDKAELQAIIDSETATSEQKELAKKGQVKLEEKRNKAQIDLGMEELQADSEWRKVFENLNNYGITTLTELKKKLDEVGEGLTENMNPADLQAYNEALKNLEQRLMDFNPKESFRSAKANLDEKKEMLRRAQISATMAEGTDEETKAKERLKAAEDAVAQATERYNVAAQKYGEWIERMNEPLKNFGQQLRNIGDSSDTMAGEIVSAIGSVIDAVTNMIDTITQATTKAVDSVDQVGEATQQTAKAAEKTSQVASNAISAVEKASVILAIISAVLQIAQQIDQMLDKKKNEAAEKRSEIAKMQDAVNDYKMAVLEAQQAEKGWFNASGMENLEKQYEKGQQALKNYYESANRMEEKYQDEQGGGFLQKAGNFGTKLGGIVGDTVGEGLRKVGMDAVADVFEYADLTQLTEKAYQAANGEGWGKGHDTMYNLGLGADNGKVRARDNLRIRTQESKKGFLGIGAKNEKTEDLETWLANNGFEGSLFGEDGMIDVQAADAVLSQFGDKLVGNTKETIEQLKESKEQYDEWLQSLKDYTSEMFGGLTDDMVDSLFNWLDTGEDVMDSFEKMSKDTFRAVGKDMIKQLSNKMIFDGFSEKMNEIYKKSQEDGWSSEQLAEEVGKAGAQLKQDVANAAPALQAATQAISDALGDISNKADAEQQRAVAGAFQTMSEDTAGVLEGRFTAVYESNLAIQGILGNIGTIMQQVANSVVGNYQTANDIRNIVVDSNLHLQTIADHAAKIEKLCTSINDSAYRTMENTNKL